MVWHMILCPEAYREADMACAYGLDLRRRVIAAIEDGPVLDRDIDGWELVSAVASER